MKDTHHIRWLIRRDMPEVLAIENVSFEFPWSEEDFVRCLRQRNCIGQVVESAGSGEIMAYTIYELHRNRLHLLNFAVHPKYRKSGIGRALIDKLKGKLSLRRRCGLWCEVRESNLAAAMFFREMGFQCVSLLREFYQDTPDDAYLFRYLIRPDDDPDGIADLARERAIR